MNRDQREDRRVLRGQIAFVVFVIVGTITLLWATSATVSDEEIRETPRVVSTR
jgi:hypothetical protein